MKIATYNVNGIAVRLPVLLRWIKEEQPEIVCLQELRAPQEKFPEEALQAAGYRAIWQGQKSWNGVAILAKGAKPIETRRGLPGDPDDTHSRYLEGQIGELLVGSVYLPNGNPAPGPKFDYKLAWFKRLNAYAATLIKSRRPIVLCGDYNAVPTELDAYKPERWVRDAVFFPRNARPLCRSAGARLARCVTRKASGRSDLYLLGLFPECLRAERRPADGSYAAQPECRPAPRERGCQPRSPQLAED